MSDAVLVAIIGVTGTVIGSVVTLLVAAMQARRSAQPATPPGQLVDPTPVLGEAVDLRELRILRALYGEPGGRAMGGYKNAYYRPSLDATVQKGWVRKAGGNYYLTSKGADFFWAYVKQTREGWKPVPPGG